MAEDLLLMSFDDALEIDEKKAVSLKKMEKREQLEDNIKKFKSEIVKMQLKFKKSIVDPRVDSVDILIEIDAKKKELEYSEKVLKAIFPNG